MEQMYSLNARKVPEIFEPILFAAIITLRVFFREPASVTLPPF